MPIYLSEDYIVVQNANTDNEKRFRTGCGEIYESYFDTVSDAYKGLVKEHGRCGGKIYIDRKDKTVIQVGWWFIKRIVIPEHERREYDEKSYLQECWVTLYSDLPERTVKYKYLQFPK